MLASSGRGPELLIFACSVSAEYSYRRLLQRIRNRSTALLRVSNISHRAVLPRDGSNVLAVRHTCSYTSSKTSSASAEFFVIRNARPKSAGALESYSRPRASALPARMSRMQSRQQFSRSEPLSPEFGRPRSSMCLLENISSLRLIFTTVFGW